MLKYICAHKKNKMKKLLSSILIACILLVCITPASAKEDSSFEEQYDAIDNSIILDRIGNSDLEAIMPSTIFTFKPASIQLKFVNPEHNKLLINKNKLKFIINGDEKELEFMNGVAEFEIDFSEQERLSIYMEDYSFSQTVVAYPLWAFLVPIGLLIGWILYRIIKR